MASTTAVAERHGEGSSERGAQSPRNGLQALVPNAKEREGGEGPHRGFWWPETSRRRVVGVNRRRVGAGFGERLMRRSSGPPIPSSRCAGRLWSQRSCQ